MQIRDMHYTCTWENIYIQRMLILCGEISRPRWVWANTSLNLSKKNSWVSLVFFRYIVKENIKEDSYRSARGNCKFWCAHLCERGQFYCAVYLEWNIARASCIVCLGRWTLFSRNDLLFFFFFQTCWKIIVKKIVSWFKEIYLSNTTRRSRK